MAPGPDAQNAPRRVISTQPGSAHELLITLQFCHESDISAIRKHLSVFWLNSYCACAETTISQVPEKDLTSPLDSATPIS